MYFNLIIDMLIDLLLIISFMFLFMFIAVLYQLIVKKQPFPEKRPSDFSQKEIYLVRGIVILDVVMILVFLINPVYEFISGDHSYQDFIFDMIFAPNSNLYQLIEYLIIRMCIMVYLGVRDERIFLRRGIYDS